MRLDLHESSTHCTIRTAFRTVWRVQNQENCKVVRRRSRKTKERHNECRTCFNKYMCELRARRRRKELKKFTAWMTRKERSARATTAICTALIARFGGVGPLAEEWKAALDAATAENPGSRLVLQNFRAIAQLLFINSMLRTPTSPEDLTEEELEIELRSLHKRMMGESG